MNTPRQGETVVLVPSPRQQRQQYETPVMKGGTVASALPPEGPNDAPSHVSENEYRRQLTKLSHGNRKVLSSQWEEAGKMDPISTQVASSVTGTLLQGFSQLTVLRQMMVQAAGVLNEFHVGELDGRPLADEVADEMVQPGEAATEAGLTPLAAVHRLWRGELTKLISQTTAAMQTITIGVDELVPFYNTTIRSVQPILVLRQARTKMGVEINKTFDLVETERSEIQPFTAATNSATRPATAGSAKNASTPAGQTAPRDDGDGFPVMVTKKVPGSHLSPWGPSTKGCGSVVELTPRVPSSNQRSGQQQAHRRPWSSGVNQALSAKVAESIQRSTRYMGQLGTTHPTAQSHEMQMLADKRATMPKRPQTANVPGGTSGFQGGGQPLVPKLKPEQSRVQVIKRTTKEAKELLTKLDVKTVVPTASSVTRGAIETGSSPRSPKVPPRVNVGGGSVPNVDNSAAVYGESHLLPHDPHSLEEKAAAVLMLKAQKSLYRSLGNEERALVLDHERKEQIYHHDHALLNMKLVGARQSVNAKQVNLCKVVEVDLVAAGVMNIPNEGDEAGAPIEGKDTEAQFKARQELAMALDRVAELERQKKHTENERARQVKFTCIGLARHKRHLPQIL